MEIVRSFEDEPSHTLNGLHITSTPSLPSDVGDHLLHFFSLVDFALCTFHTLVVVTLSQRRVVELEEAFVQGLGRDLKIGLREAAGAAGAAAGEFKVQQDSEPANWEASYDG